MFKPFTLYTHKRMLDVAIMVLKSTRLLDGRYSLKVKWMDRLGRDYACSAERIKISKEEVKNWYVVET